MQNVMPESLLNTQNDFMRIFRESENTEERVMAIYLRALEKDVFRFYKPRHNPPQPEGWLDAYQDYLAVNEKEAKTKVWKGIQDKFKGYLTAMQQSQDDNWSNFLFLKEMSAFFKSKFMTQQCFVLESRMNEFRDSGVFA